MHSVTSLVTNLPPNSVINLVIRQFYSKHHTAERWDLEFGSNTTEKFGKPVKKSVKLDPVGSSVRYEVMKLCTGSV